MNRFFTLVLTTILWIAACSGVAQSASRSDAMAQLPRPLQACRSNAPVLSVAPFPTLHPDALNARVPVMMYHDILPAKKVAYDLTPQELRQHFERIRSSQLTPISLDRLIAHLRTGSQLPEKPILLTFDDGYGGHYQYAYPLLKEYGYPAVFSIHTSSVGVNVGRTHVSWQDLKTMANDPLVTIASHSKTHPALTRLSDQKLTQEVVDSKKILESKLARPVQYFTYPYGNYDARVKRVVANAGYLAAIAFAMPTERFANQSTDLLSLARFEKSQLEKVIPRAWGGSSKLCQ
ncbi:MAG: polysaccharide deacetylase family protein [Myxacorys californica WJT36-NPBG1]|jgi:peptidoglycan/xylan/chitin deacetylase (PgdA/CDA1 family)|nr:polysaccharide deacetylase family protein [Myxacorys californica WJT36-NPBG1]